MTIIYVRQDGMGQFTEIRPALEAARAGDTVEIHKGIYPESLDTYDFAMASGESWSRKITVRAKAGHGVEVSPLSGMFALRLAHSQHYVEFQRITFNGLHVEHSSVKLTHSGPDRSTQVSHIRLRDCLICDGHAQGIELNADDCELIRCRFERNGSTDYPMKPWQLHGAYISGSRNQVIDCDASLNLGNGIVIQDLSDPLRGSYNVVKNFRGRDNARCGYGGGIYLGAGRNNVLDRPTCTGAQYGIRVSARVTGTRIIREWVHGNTPHPYNLQIPTGVYVEDGAIVVFE